MFDQLLSAEKADMFYPLQKSEKNEQYVKKSTSAFCLNIQR